MVHWRSNLTYIIHLCTRPLTEKYYVRLEHRFRHLSPNITLEEPQNSSQFYSFRHLEVKTSVSQNITLILNYTNVPHYKTHFRSPYADENTAITGIVFLAVS